MYAKVIKFMVFRKGYALIAVLIGILRKYPFWNWTNTPVFRFASALETFNPPQVGNHICIFKTLNLTPFFFHNNLVFDYGAI